jgi:predicted unusual protein kinase regulating ubiquinone biosynthesis (AarF/ABC1/UbiB family)
MAVIQQTIAKMNKIEDLMILRDGFRNEALAQTAEVRLYELAKPLMEYLQHPAVKPSLDATIKNLHPDLQSEVRADPQLATILATFSKPSRERDRHLKPFLEKMNSRTLKEALGALLTDPSTNEVSRGFKFESRALIDSVLGFISHLSAYDKAQCLLYFMGERQFESLIKVTLLEGGNAKINEIRRLEKKAELLNRSSKTTIYDECDPPIKIPNRFPLPDALVRAQKIFGISIDTAEKLQGGLLDKGTLIDLLHESLFGKDGITLNNRISKQFFKAVGETLVSKSPQLASLSTEKQGQLAQFVSFAFERCPQDRLPNVILRVWEAFQSNEQDTPQVVASILQGLGPAFVKFGQKLYTLNLPDDYKVAFRTLSSQNQESDSSLFYHIVEALSRGKIFDEESSGRKIAEGSMAATYHATVKDSGKTSVAKVIHPFIPDEIEQDTKYIIELISYINEKKPFGNLTIPDNTGEMLRKQLSEQIDTKREIRMAGELAKALKSKKGVVNFEVPEVDKTNSVEGIIITQLMPGYELDNPEIERQGLNSQKIRNAVGLEVLRLLLIEQVYQSDVNLGNFGLLKEENGTKIITKDGAPTVVWYDAGAVQEITKKDQQLLLSIAKAAFKNPGDIPNLLTKMVKEGDENADKIEKVCANFASLITNNGDKSSLDKVETYFNQFFDLLAKEGLQVEEKWLEIGNTLSMAAPLLKGADQKDLENLVIEALKYHQMLSTNEKLGLTLRGLLTNN